MASTSGRVRKDYKQGMNVSGSGSGEKNRSPTVNIKPAKSHSMKHHSPLLMR